VSETVNTIIKKSKLKIMPVQYAPGHHPSEVAVGVILGIISAILGFL
jgi:acid phosphatase family membrane protein YuiD